MLFADSSGRIIQLPVRDLRPSTVRVDRRSRLRRSLRRVRRAGPEF